MRLPRDVSGDELIKRLRKVDYKLTRSTGSHARLTRASPKGEHHITVPLHKNLRAGTLNNILTDVATHLKISKQDLLDQLFS